MDREWSQMYNKGDGGLFWKNNEVGLSRCQAIRQKELSIQPIFGHCVMDGWKMMEQ
jgi:hypothetical protein